MTTKDIFLPFTFFLFLISYFFHPIPLQQTNVDLGHHLLLGKITIEQGSVPQTNFVSFTHPEYVFVNNQWLSEVVFYLVYTWANFNGLITLSVLLITATFMLLLYYAKKEQLIIPAVLVGFLNIQMIIDRTEIKPELFSFFFLSLFLLILYSYKKNYTRWIFLLPPLMMFWINFHIFFVVGLTVICLFLFDTLSTKMNKLTSQKNLTLILVFILSIIAACINPNFIKGVIYPFHVLNNYGYDVIENLTVFSAIMRSYTDITFFYFFLSLFLLWSGIAFFYKNLERIEIYLSLLFTALAFFAVRNFPLFAIGVFIPMTHIFYFSWEYLKKRIEPVTFFNLKIFLAVLFILIISPGIIVNFSLHSMGTGVIDNTDEAIQFFQANHIKGPIFNNYNIGNYLEYRLYPQEKIFVDGNPEQYPASFFTDVYYPMENSFTQFQKLSNIYHINTVMYEHKNQTENQNPFLASLIKSNEWKMVYLDSDMVIFVRNLAQNNQLITSHMVNEKNVQIKKEDLESENKIKDLSNLFRVIGWYGKMAEMDKAYLTFDPYNCVALRHIIVVMRKDKNPEQPYLSLYQQHCTQ